MTYRGQQGYKGPRIEFSWLGDDDDDRNGYRLISSDKFTVTYTQYFAQIRFTPVGTLGGTDFLIKICDNYPRPSLPYYFVHDQLRKLQTFLSGLVNAGLLETTNERRNAIANYPSVTYKVTQSWRRVPENPLEFSDREASDPQGNENPPANDGNEGHHQNPLSNHSQFVTNPYLLLSGEYPQHENKHI